MAEEQRTCSSCGASVPSHMDRCELCGTPVDSSRGESPEPVGEAGGGETDRPDSTSDPASGPGTEGNRSVFCNQCGWENPPGARYCSQCGSKLQDLESAPSGTRPVSADLPSGSGSEASEESESSEEPSEEVEMGRQIVLFVGGALVVVLAFFGVTQWSSQYEWSTGSNSGSSASAAEAQTGPSGSTRPPMSGESSGRQGPAPVSLQALLEQYSDSLAGTMAGQIDSLRGRVEEASGGEKRELQAELVNLLIGAGHPGRAAVVQKEIADATGSVEARRRAADLLYRWMQKVQRQGQRKAVFQVAQHAADAYAAVVEERPNDLDARTRMGEAYLLTNNPMKGIQAINAVLNTDSTFVPARFQKGLALLQINRLDQAVQQFEMVKQYAEEGAPFYRQADRALTVIEQQRSAASSSGATGGS